MCLKKYMWIKVFPSTGNFNIYVLSIQLGFIKFTPTVAILAVVTLNSSLTLNAVHIHILQESFQTNTRSAYMATNTD